MTKKNTLLYLDEKIVKEAKRYGINISQVAEAAIRNKMFPNLSTGERILMDIPGYLEDLKKEGRCFFLPKTIEEVSFKNIGVLDDNQLKFKEGLNFIKGESASGKTTLIRAIAIAFGLEDSKLPLLATGKKRGRIEIKTGKNPITLEYIQKQQEITMKGGFQCILIDDGGGMLNSKKRKEFFEGLKQIYKCQIISTTLMPPKDVKGHVVEIPLKKFK